MSWTASAALKISSQTFLPDLFAESLSTGNTLRVWESESPQKSDLSPSSFCTFPSKTPKGSHLPVGRCKYPRLHKRECSRSHLRLSGRWGTRDCAVAGSRSLTWNGFSYSLPLPKSCRLFPLLQPVLPVLSLKWRVILALLTTLGLTSRKAWLPVALGPSTSLCMDFGASPPEGYSEHLPSNMLLGSLSHPPTSPFYVS